MRPLGLFARIASPDLHASHRDAGFEWRDTIEVRAGVPVALSKRAKTVQFQLPKTATTAEAVLRGIRLDTNCCDEHQPDDEPCNSNGFWPTKFAVHLGPVRLDRAHGQAEVDVEVVVERGWTPMRGGVPYIEEKPLNASLDYRVEVGVTLLSGDDKSLVATRAGTESSGSARRRRSRSARCCIQDVGAGTAAVGITGFGFSFEKRGSAAVLDHRGRYLTSLDFRVGEVDLDVDAGTAELVHHSGVWIPRTVVGTRVRSHLETSLLQLRHPDATNKRGSTRGSLCIHSSAQAPFFSYWKPSAGKYGPIQSEDVRSLG